MALSETLAALKYAFISYRHDFRAHTGENNGHGKWRTELWALPFAASFLSPSNSKTTLRGMRKTILVVIFCPSSKAMRSLRRRSVKTLHRTSSCWRSMIEEVSRTKVNWASPSADQNLGLNFWASRQRVTDQIVALSLGSFVFRKL